MMKIVLHLLVFCCITSLYSQEWVSVGGGANNTVRGIYVDEITNNLYAVGTFDSIGGVNAYRVAYWDGSVWNSLCDPPYILDSNPIMSAIVYNNELYVAGMQYLMGDSITGSLSHLNNGEWEKFGSPDGATYLESFDNKLFVYNNFQTIGNKPLKYIATWDGANWEPFGDTSITNHLNIAFLADIEMYNSNYVVGGNINDTQYKELMQWDGLTWKSLSNGIPGGSAWVNCMKSYQGILYIGGYFNAPNFPEFLVAWDGEKFFKPFSDVNYIGQVWDLEVINNELYILGPVQIGTSPETYGITKFNGDSICAFGGSDLLINPPYLRMISEINGELYFNTIKTILDDTVNYIVKWNGSAMDTCISSPVHLGVNKLESPTMSIYPNPSKGKITIAFSEEHEDLTLTFVNLDGKILKVIELSSNVNSYTLEIENKGMIFYSLQGTNTFLIGKMVLE